MELWSNTKIANYPIFKIKKLLFQGTFAFLTIENTAQMLEIKKYKAKILLQELCELGYIQHITFLNEDKWNNATLGNVVANTTIKRLMTKKVANYKIEEFLKRVKDVNENSEFLFTISSVKLFIDFQECESFVKYLRFAVMFKQKEKNDELHKKLEMESIRKSKRHFSNIVEEFIFPRTKILEYLKNGNHNLIVSDERNVRYLDDYEDLVIPKDFQ